MKIQKVTCNLNLFVNFIQHQWPQQIIFTTVSYIALQEHNILFIITWIGIGRSRPHPSLVKIS